MYLLIEYAGYCIQFIESHDLMGEIFYLKWYIQKNFSSRLRTIFLMFRQTSMSIEIFFKFGGH